MEAIRLIRIVADHIETNQDAFKTLRYLKDLKINKQTKIIECFSGDDVALIPIEDRVWLRGWFPLMFELSAVIR